MKMGKDEEKTKGLRVRKGRKKSAKERSRRTRRRERGKERE
jgi:hypothetical protein